MSTTEQVLKFQCFVEPLRVSVIDAAKLLGISRARLYQHVKAGTITPVKDGDRTLFTMQELRRFAEVKP